MSSQPTLRQRVTRLTLFGIITLAIGLGYVVWNLSYTNAVSVVFPPRTSAGAVDLSAYGVDEYEEVSFTTEDGFTLYGWYVPPAPEADGASILFFHGHGSNRWSFPNEVRFLREDGYGMLLFDFRNHGESDGESSSMGFYEVNDAVAAYEFLASQPEVNADKIAIFGASMGGAMAILGAAQLPDVKAVVAITAYSDMHQLVKDGVVIRTGLPPSPFAEIVMAMMNQMSGSDMYQVSPLNAMADLGERPFFMMHGTADTTIPVDHAQRLYDAAQGEKELIIVEGGGHGDLTRFEPEEYERRVRDFLGRYLLVDG